ncbi:MAG TPA: M43 family zinc metalloprotease [Segetibacter sp.]|jgi:PKD repeat protein
MKKLLFAVVLLLSFQSFGQKRACGTMPVNKRNQELLRQQFPNGQRQIKSTGKQFQLGKRATTVYNIPVIVHVIHSGEAVGTGKNISAAQIQSQISVLNEDFRNLNADKSSIPLAFQANQADVQFNFCLAAIDKNGNVMPEPGIDRVDKNSYSWTDAPYDFEYIDDNIKPATIWNPSNYLNIWITDISDDVLGYSQFPDNNANLGGIDPAGGLATTDGVVIQYSTFGRVGNVSAPYNKGRTTTHEMGHFFGLRHIWGDESCGNDFCNDTPVQEQENTGCPSFPHISCSNAPNGDMFMNFMDYTDDRCMFMFTIDQKDRMHSVMAANTPRRSSLAASTVCNTTAVPSANFTFSPINIVAGSTVTFSDVSIGNPSGWSWNFGGGAAINTSTDRNPTATFNNAGSYQVSLTATNANGSNTITKTVIVTAFNCADTLTNFRGTPALYTVSTAGQQGYVSGHNSYLDKSKAEKFNYTGPALKVDKLVYFFGVAKGTGSITATVWQGNGAGGTPGTVLYSQAKRIDSLKTGGAATVITLPNLLTINGSFYVGITLNYAAGDTVALLTNKSGEAESNTAWEQWEDNDWYEYSDPGAWNISVNHMVAVLFDNRTQPGVSTSVCSNADVTNTATFTDASCGVIAKIEPSGAARVSGGVSTCVSTQTGTINFNGQPYVRRYFDINPSTNASTATGTITLYFRDEDFANYNTNRGANPPLPTVAGGANSDAAKASLIVTQFHGTSSSGQPGTYNGATVDINPDDNKIVWNTSLNAWEVTFNVTGFSGFFVHTGATVLPITMEYFKGQKQGTINLLSWKSNCLSTSVDFEIERSTNGRNFSAIGNINATQARCASPFDYTDNHPLPGTNYYRLKMTEIDGNVSYSKVVTLFTKNGGIEIVSLVPTLVDKGSAILNVSASKDSKLDLFITDVQGRVIQKLTASLQSGYNNVSINLSNLAAGSYNISGHTADGKTRTVRFVKQ